MKSKGLVAWTQYRELESSPQKSSQSPALPRLAPQQAQARQYARAETEVPSPSQRFARAQTMPPDLQIAAGLMLAGTTEDKWPPSPGLESIPVSPMQTAGSTTPLRYEEHDRLRKDLERLAPGSTRRTSPARGGPSKTHRSRRSRSGRRSPHGAVPQRPSSRKPRPSSMQRLKRGQSITSLQTELLLNQFCEVETFGLEEEELFDDVVLGWEATADGDGKSGGTISRRVADHVKSSHLLRSMLESTDRPSALAASIALNCLRRLAQHLPAYSSLIYLISSILEDAVFQEDGIGQTVAGLRAKVRDLLGGASSGAGATSPSRSGARSRRRRGRTSPHSGDEGQGKKHAPPSPAKEEGSGGDSGGGLFLTATVEAAAPNPSASLETPTAMRGFSESDGAGGAGADEVDDVPEVWRPVRRVMHSETAGRLARDTARLAAAYATAKRELASQRSGNAPLLFRGDAQRDAAAVEQDLDRLDDAARQRAISAGLMKRLYERAADGEQETFRRWCLQRAAPEDLAAHFAEAPPAAVVELATPQLCHSGAHLAQLVKRADGVAARAALAACHEEVAASLRDDKALCMQVARNAPVVVQRMLEVGADAVPEFVLKRPSMLQGVVKEQISRDPNWLPEICTDPDLFQSVVEANTGLLSVSLRRKRPMLIDYVKDPDSFESLCQLAEVTSSVMARMIASSPVVFDELYEHHTSVMVGRVRESDTVVRDLCSDRTADCATWSLETLAEADPDLGLKGSTAAEVLDPFHLAVVPPRVEVAVQTQPPKAPAGFDLDKRSTVGDVPLHAVPAKPKKGKKSKAVKPQQLEGTVVADLLAQLVAAKIHADRADFERGRLTEHLTDFVITQMQTMYEGKEYDKQVASLCLSLETLDSGAAAAQEMRQSLGPTPALPYNNNRGIVLVEVLGALCGKDDPFTWSKRFFMSDCGEPAPTMTMEDALALLERADLIERCNSRMDRLTAWAEGHTNEEGQVSLPTLVGELMRTFDEAAAEEEERLTKLFHDTDEDGDGAISLEEFTTMVRSLDPNVDVRMLRRLFDLARGGGKSISPARFTMIMRLRSS